ncbi:DNA mismatch repair protein MutS [Lachnospiraceae bacterium NE2001]|nr:DNA mismatch repair protein MutS [Lachnospiraceae bacterium NE2001]
MNSKDIDRTKLSPMMQHYLATKDEHPDSILFYRLGDFYEMFFEDAEDVSRELELTLTGKDCGMEERAPMCGIPYHAAEIYIGKLIEKGHKVAICEQVQDPKLAKGLVERKVIRIVTPGTNMGDSSLVDDKNKYIMCISELKRAERNGGTVYGIAVSDISTGEFNCTSIGNVTKILDEIVRYQPKEIVIGENAELVNNNHFMSTYYELLNKLSITESKIKDNKYNIDTATKIIEGQFRVSGVEGLGLKDYPEIVSAAGALIGYLYDTQMSSLGQINHLKLYFANQYMIIDSSTKRNLELTETMRDGMRYGSLLWVLDKTKTAMGARKLRSFIETPLMDRERIEDRLDAIEALNVSVMDRDEMREYLSSIYDMERLMTRISMKTANPRDLLSFKTSLTYLPAIQNLFKEFTGKLFSEMYQNMDTLQDIYEILERAIDEDAPITVREGGIFKSGYNLVIDDYRDKKLNAKNILAELEEREREKTGIKNLKIKFNRVFGYFLEVTNSYKSLVPDYFIRKQTLANAERFTTDELSRLSSDILSAEENLFGLEYDEFVKLRDELALEIERVQRTADYIAIADVMASLSVVSVRANYVRPAITEDGIIDIKGGRHPVIEKIMNQDDFIPNDTYLDGQGNRIMIITGPNMAGKSTYMRQTALISLMAQIGSFVPADSASISICDRIFTRVGASDDLSQGQSTFMVEMSEVANILRNATRDSLIIMDEIGRGTSTFDGLSIAWAVVEYIADKDSIGAKTLFATHYHELTDLEDKLSSVNNYSIAIKHDGDSLVFLRKIIPGGADRSYGIEVAELAGVPSVVTDRAKEIAAILSEEDITGRAKDIKVVTSHKEAKKSKDTPGQLSLFASTEEMNITSELKNMDLDNMTPVKALLYLQELKERLN